MKKLHMTFLNEDGGKKTLIIHCVDQHLSAEAVKEAMRQITELELFEKEGVRLMTKVHSAKYVEIIETPLFDVNEEPADETSMNETSDDVAESGTEQVIKEKGKATAETFSKQIVSCVPALSIGKKLALLTNKLIHRFTFIQIYRRLQTREFACLDPPEKLLNPDFWRDIIKESASLGCV